MKTILLVEDNQLVSKLVKKLLNNNGYKVIAVENGLDAIKVCVNTPIDFAYMDIDMPYFNGIYATMVLRSQGHDFPIVGYSGHEALQHSQDYKSAGFNGFLKKTFDEKIILQTIGHHLNKVDKSSTVIA